MDYPPHGWPNYGPVNQPHYFFGGAYSLDDTTQAMVLQQSHVPSQHIASYGLKSDIGNDAELGGAGQPTIGVPAELPPLSMSQPPRQPKRQAFEGVPALIGPSRPRKRKAKTLKEPDWEPYRDRIRELHFEQKMPLPKVMEKIEEQYGFRAGYVALSRWIQCHADTGSENANIDHASPNGAWTRMSSLTRCRPSCGSVCSGTLLKQTKAHLLSRCGVLW